MIDLKNNLNKRICDCEEGSKNTETYLEYIIWGYKYINCPLSEKQIKYICNDASNEELNNVLEEIDYLVTK